MSVYDDTDNIKTDPNGYAYSTTGTTTASVPWNSVIIPNATGYGYVKIGDSTFRIEGQQPARPADEALRLLDEKWSLELQEMEKECYLAEKEIFAQTDNLVNTQGNQPIGVYMTRSGAAIPITLSRFADRIAQKRAFGGE